jgi:hypothetical protein
VTFENSPNSQNKKKKSPKFPTIRYKYFVVYLLLTANFGHVHLAAHVLETEDWSSCSEQHSDQISPSAVSYETHYTEQ